MITMKDNGILFLLNDKKYFNIMFPLTMSCFNCFNASGVFNLKKIMRTITI
jgi:hypothetical protein